jgi:hypothetical protein
MTPKPNVLVLRLSDVIEKGVIVEQLMLTKPSRVSLPH